MDKEAERLEALWSGQFGDYYTHRNSQEVSQRQYFWDPLIDKLRPSSVLEVGCNIGLNLKWIARERKAIKPEDTPFVVDTYGVDINKYSLKTLRESLPYINGIYAKGRDLPFKDGYFDLVFTCGVLIHQPSESLGQVMAEVVRCSKRYVLCMEYDAPSREAVEYRGNEGSLFRDCYGPMYVRNHGLKLLAQGKLSKDEGFDDLTWHLLER